jgi:hypothetical protein
MAYNAVLLCDLQADLRSLANDLRAIAARVGVPLESASGGEGWHSATFGGAGSGTATVEIHVADESTRAELRGAAEQVDESLLADVNGIVVLTLSGDLNKSLVEGIVDLFRSSCRVAHDDVAGYAMDL